MSDDISAQLVSDHIDLAPDARVALLAAGNRAFVLEIARRAAFVDVFDLHHSALARLHPLPDNVTVHESVFPAPEPGYTAVVVFVPKGRELLRLYLWRAALALHPGGSLYLAGANASGAKSAIHDAAALFGEAVTLDTRKRQRLAVAERPPGDLVYPWGEPPPQTPQPRTLDTPRGPVTVATVPGVFSWEALDNGTRFLLDHLDAAGERALLDVGCGYGVIAFALADTGASLTLTDDNLLAVACARQGATLNGLSATVYAGDVYAALDGQRFDLITSNPPFHKGVAVNMSAAQRIIKQAADYLTPQGRLVIVANAFLPYESLFEQTFARTRVIAQDRRYKVVEGRVR